MNLLVLGNLNSFDEIDHNSAVQFLNVLIFSELCQPALLLGEAGANLIFIADQTGYRIFGILNPFVKLCLKDVVPGEEMMYSDGYLHSIVHTDRRTYPAEG